jgi:hypothetical protein
VELNVLFCSRRLLHLQAQSLYQLESGGGEGTGGRRGEGEWEGERVGERVSTMSGL